MTLFASLMEGQREHSGIYTVGGKRRVFNALDNTAGELKFQVAADEDGVIEIIVACAEGADWAYLNFIEVAGRFREAGASRWSGWTDRRW